DFACSLFRCFTYRSFSMIELQIIEFGQDGGSAHLADRLK
ncbi:MAG: hypothetical protein QOJ51_5315, partial [Acidobacteriaceae bacterium]|nr:hypothetical protein [Acidobacteriaceae bacterium]